MDYEGYQARVLVVKKSYGWEFCPVIANYEGLVSGFIIMNDRGEISIVKHNDIYQYYSEDEIEQDRFYYFDYAISRRVGTEE